MQGESVPIEASDLLRLKRAVFLLERSNLASLLAQAIGRPVTAILGSLPNIVSVGLQKASREAILLCLRFAIRPSPRRKLLPNLAGQYSKLISGVAGAVGGFVGVPGMAVELPITTFAMFQSIARIAEEEGEDLSKPEARLACLEVFGLSTGSKGTPKSESKYYAARKSLSKSLDEASNYVLQRSSAQQTAPVLLQFVTAVASRFGVLVSEELAAAAIPVVGAVTGASLNIVFTQHFNNIAQGHFVVRALERKYGKRAVREQYDRIFQQSAKRKAAPANPRTVGRPSRNLTR